MSRERRSASGEERSLQIESLDLEAHGVARDGGKVVFVRGALPGERVRARTVRSKPKFDVAEVVAIERESSARVAPRCPHYGVCGGCSMQHVDPRAQLAFKQRVLEDQLWHLARARPQAILRPLAGSPYGYRYRARLSVRHVPKKGGVLVGFHERHSSYVADMTSCQVLPPAMSDRLPKLRELVASLSLRERLPQIEFAQGSDVTALVFRVLDAPSSEDLERLRAFAARERVEVWLQRKGPDAIELLATDDGELAGAQGVAASRLSYRLPEFGVTMPFRPTDFTQVNHAVNAALVRRAVRLLDPGPHERVADLFCGLGNFSLPIARRAREVVGIEGSATLVARAREAAALNGLAARTRFEVANLFEMTASHWMALGAFDRLLIDPPREGALEVARALAADAHRPARIVYVSCNPATLARDVAVLAHEGRYVLRAAGVVDMFPHTSHVESIAVLEPGDG